MADFSLMTVLRTDMKEFRQGMSLANSLMQGYGRQAKYSNKNVSKAFNSSFVSVGKMSVGLNSLTSQMFAFSGSLLGVGALSSVFSGLNESTTDYARNAETALTEVSTISNEVYANMGKYNAQMVGISSNVGEMSNDISSAYYEIVSAGHNGAAGLEVLKASSVAAVGGLTETKIAADGITNVLNAWKISATESTRVSDVFFKGVEKGKTKFEELAAGIADVSPIASKLNIGYEDLIESSAKLTASGTPTSVAFTQISSAIAGISKAYGSGIFQGKTFREVMMQVYQDTGGEYEKLLNKLGRKEGVSAVLALGGGERSEIMAEYESFFNGLDGATDRAFNRMAETTGVQMRKVGVNISNYMLPASQELNVMMGSVAKSINEAFEEGRIDELFSNMVDWAGVAAGAILVLKAGFIAGQVELAYYSVGIKALTVYETANAAIKGALVTVTRTYNLTLALTGSTMKAVTAATRVMWASMASNPLTLVIASMGILTAAYFALRKEVVSTDDIIKASNNSLKQASKIKATEGMVSEYEALKQKTSLSADEQERYNVLVKDLSIIFPDAVGKMNEYGDAIEINTDKVRKATGQQKADLLQSYADQKEINDKKIQELKRRIDAQKKLMQTEYETTTYVSNGFGGTQVVPVKVETDAESREEARASYEALTEELNKVLEVMRTNAIEVRKLEGDYKSVTSAFPELFADMKNKSSAELDDIRKKLNSLLVLDYDESDLNAIKKQIQEIKALQETTTKNTDSGFNVADFRNALNKQKELYDLYERDIKVFGEAYAKDRHANLLKEGRDFKEYLEKRLGSWKDHNKKMAVVADVAANAGISFSMEKITDSRGVSSVSSLNYNSAPDTKIKLEKVDYANPFEKGSKAAKEFDRQLKEMNRTTATLWETMESGQAPAQVIGAAIQSVQDELVNMAETGSFSFESVATSALKSGQQIVNQLLIQAIAGMIAGESSKGVVGLALAGIGIAGILSMFAANKSKANNVAKLANGAVVTGDTLVRVGEYSGAASNPEVIAPLDKLKTLMKREEGMGAGLVEFTIRGEVLKGVLRNHERKTGKRG